MGLSGGEGDGGLLYLGEEIRFYFSDSRHDYDC